MVGEGSLETHIWPLVSFLALKVSMEWGTCLEAMEAALELEKMVNQSLLELTKAADDKGDSHLSDFLDEFLEDQVKAIFKLIWWHNWPMIF